jgi:hypothetical protein
LIVSVRPVAHFTGATCCRQRYLGAVGETQTAPGGTVCYKARDPRPQSVKLELEFELLCAVAARAGAALDADNPPVFAREGALEVAIEELAIGRRDFEAEWVVAVADDLAPNFPRRASDEARQRFARGPSL